MSHKILIVTDDALLASAVSDQVDEALRADVQIVSGAPGSFMFMPAGKHVIVCGTGDRNKPRPVEVEVLIDSSSVEVMRAQMATIRRNYPNARPFIDFFHANKEAAFWPEDFFWAESPQPGVYVRGEWSAAGKQAVDGKVIRCFSPEFRVDDIRKKPARLRCSEAAGLNLGGFTNDPAFRDNLPLWAKHAGTPGVVNSNKNNINSMTKEKLAALEAQLNQLQSEIDAIRAQGFGPDELATQLGSKESEAALLAQQIEAGKLALRNVDLEDQLMAQRTKDAAAAVDAAVKRGAIGVKDEALQATWKKKLIEDPSNGVLLAAMKGHVNLNPPPQRAEMVLRGYRGETREDSRNVLRAMSACQKRQTPDVQYTDKVKLAQELSALYANEIIPRLKEGDDIPLRGDNSLGTLAATITSIRTLELLTLTFPLLKSICTDFSDQIVSYKDTLKSRFVGIPTVQTYNETTGWPTVSDANMTDVSITYNQYKGVPISIQAHHIAGTIRRLFDEIAPAQAYALGKDIVDYVYSLIIAASFTGVALADSATGAAVPTIAAGIGTFGRSTVIDIGGAMDDNKNPEMGRTLLLNRVYYSALAKDQAIITLAAMQKSEIIEKGVLPDVEGFKVVKAVNLPATAIGGKVLKGFGFTKSALCLATRLSADYVNAIPGAGHGNLQVITTPGGFSANQVQFVQHSGVASANQRLEVIYGASPGQSAAGMILTDV